MVIIITSLHFVPEERLELSHLAILDFESSASTIPPLRHFPLQGIMSDAFCKHESYDTMFPYSNFSEKQNMELYSNSIFFIETDKIKPNPFQPRREFDEARLKDLAESIRQYGVLQPLVVCRLETVRDDGGMVVEYELIAGERRLRAAKLAGVLQVPVVIRVGDSSMTKLELAIIENLQREDLNAVERARAFHRLVDEFGFTHGQIGQKMGKSREYVSNTMRLLSLPQDILDGLSAGKISEGHTRPLLMLADRAAEQSVLFKEIVYKKMSVREAEKFARRSAVEKIRNKEYIPDPEIIDIEARLGETLGTRVHIEKRADGGQITIDFFTTEDLHSIMDMLKNAPVQGKTALMDRFIEATTPATEEGGATAPSSGETHSELIDLSDDRTEDDKNADDNSDLYTIKNFSL